MNKHYFAAVLLAMTAIANNNASENIPLNQFSGLI